MARHLLTCSLCSRQVQVPDYFTRDYLTCGCGMRLEIQRQTPASHAVRALLFLIAAAGILAAAVTLARLR